jgi:hypothetical protein
MSKDKTDDTLKSLQEELNNIVKDLDEEGLLFMIEQANVLRYNMQVDKINSVKMKQQAEQKKNKKTDSGKQLIEIIPDENKANFIIQIDTCRKFISRQDFRNMVQVSQSESEMSQAAKNLFNWLMKERKDFLIDNNIQSKNDPRLKGLVQEIISKYKVKQ